MHPRISYIREPKIAEFDVSLWVEQKILHTRFKVPPTRNNKVVAYIWFDVSMDESVFMTGLDC